MVASRRLQESRQTPKCAGNLFSSHFGIKYYGHLATLHLLDSFRRGARYPSWLGNCSPLNFGNQKSLPFGIMWPSRSPHGNPSQKHIDVFHYFDEEFSTEIVGWLRLPMGGAKRLRGAITPTVLAKYKLYEFNEAANHIGINKTRTNMIPNHWANQQ